MQVLFVDESGTPPAPDKVAGEPLFVLGGVMIPDEFWHKVKADLEVVKRDYAIKGEIKWRYFMPPKQGAKQHSLSHLSGEDKEKVRSALYSIIRKYKAIRTLCAITDSRKAYNLGYIKKSDDLYWYSYKQIAERFQYYLQDISRISGQKINGIIVCDHRAPKDDRRLQELHDRMLKGQHDSHSSYSHLIEGLFIAPSDLSVGIQLADMVAGAALRQFKASDDRFFKQIEDTLRRSERGQVEGYGIIRFPKA